MQTEKFFQKMSDGTEIAVNRWIPEDEENIKGVVVLSHGMLEHALRYDRIGCIFAENGFVFNAHDHRGHGKTAQNAESKGLGTFGKLADKDGFNKVSNDLYEVIDEVKKDYPNKKIILLGHSFGSFVAQDYIEKHGNEISACVLTGSSGIQKMEKIGNFVISIVSLFNGKNKKSERIQRIAFNGYNDRFLEEKSDIAWLSKSESNKMMYTNDSWCGGVATISFFKDLTAGLIQIHKKVNMKKIPLDLPILALSGSDDPVSEYGKTIKKLIETYNKLGVKNASLKIYMGDRHEILNEDDGEQVIKDILDWIEKI